MKLTERLGREWLFFDGGTGTILQERGLTAGELPETWNLTRPEELIAVHRAYLDAGSDIICANTFGANALKFPQNLREIVEAGIRNAQQARREGRQGGCLYRARHWPDRPAAAAHGRPAV